MYSVQKNFLFDNRLLLIVGAVLLLFVILFLWPFRTVTTGFRGVITQFGAIKSIEQEGLVILPPWQSLNLFNVRAEEASIDGAEGSTLDTQPVTVNLTVRYSIKPDKVAEVFEKYSRNGDLSSYVSTATSESFKTVTARYSAPDLIVKRDQVSKAIFDVLQAKIEKYGAQVINIDMRNFSFSGPYMKAVNDKVMQEQLRLTAENKLRTVEAEQKQKIAIAEAEAIAEIKKAEGQAKSIQLQGEALRANKDLLELKKVEVKQIEANKWDGKLPSNYYSSLPIPILNVPAKQ